MQLADPFCVQLQTINNSVGMVLHSLLLVPYHSWRISHSRHHKATGHMSRDQVTFEKFSSPLCSCM